MTTLIFVVCAYLIGSVSFAVLMSKAFGLADPRSYGSGNPGATNVLRSGKKAAAALTLIGDAAKGWLAVFLWVWAPLVSLARVAMGVHYVSDVVAGAIFGVLVALIGFQFSAAIFSQVSLFLVSIIGLPLW